MAEHAVIVRFNYGADNLGPLYNLEDELQSAIAAAGAGEFDGNEMAVGLGDGSLYIYGPDADALFAVVRPLLIAADCLRNIRVTLRYGPPQNGVPERIVTL